MAPHARITILILLGNLAGASLPTAAAAPEFEWLNLFAGEPEERLGAIAATNDGFVGAIAGTTPMPFRAPDGSLECHTLMHYANGRWSSSGKIPAAGPNNCGLLSGAVPIRDVTPFNGSICIGGDFLDIDGTDKDYFACHTSAGSWQQINGPGNGPSGPVLVLASDNLNIYLGGSFTSVNNADSSISARRIVRTDGVLWDPLWSDDVHTSEGVASTVQGILITASAVYAGVGGGVSRWVSGAVDKWTALGSGNSGNPVYDIELNGTRIAASSSLSTTFGGWSAGAISEYDNGSMEWSAVGSSAGLNTGFGQLTIGLGFLVATGNFTAIDPAARGIARLNTQGEWEAMVDAEALGFPFASSFTDLIQAPGLGLCAKHQGGLPDPLIQTRRIACNDGIRWRGLAQGIQGEVTDMVRYQGDLIAAGRFDAAGDALVDYIARWDGGAWDSLGGGLQFSAATGANPGDVRAVAVFDGELYAMGLFNLADGTAAPGLARWNGSQWNSVGEGINLPGSMMQVWDGQLIMQGTTPSGLGPILRWDGSQLSEFADLPGGVSPTAMSVYQNSLIAAYVVGGSAHLVRWSGSQWEAFADTLIFGRAINALAANGNDLYAGGSLVGSSVNGQIDLVGRWDGSQWHPLGAGLGPDDGFSKVSALLVVEGNLIATGSFEISGLDALGGLAVWDGSAWFPLGAGLVSRGATSTVPGFGNTLLLDADRIFVGGSFKQSGSTWAENLGAVRLQLQTVFESGFEAE